MAKQSLEQIAEKYEDFFINAQKLLPKGFIDTLSGNFSEAQNELAQARKGLNETIATFEKALGKDYAQVKDDYLELFEKLDFADEESDVFQNNIDDMCNKQYGIAATDDVISKMKKISGAKNLPNDLQAC
jgi:predicted nuclease with TOPRIM domain